MGLMYQDMLSGVVSRIQVKDIEIAESLRTTKHKPPTLLGAKHVPALLCHIVAEELFLAVQNRATSYRQICKTTSDKQIQITIYKDMYYKY